MEVRAYCDLNLQVIQALIRMQLFGKRDPKKRMRFWGALYGCLAAAIVLEMIAWGFDANLLKLLIVCGIAVLLGCYLYFLLPRIRYQGMANMRQTRNEYIFTDSGLSISSCGADMQGQSHLSYSAFVKAVETEHYLFLFSTVNQGFVVDNTTITGGTVEDIRSVLQPGLGKKSIICKY